jgi:MAPEG family protein
MTRDQKKVLVGAASGIVSMVAAMWLLTSILPQPDAPTAGDRLAYAAVCNAFAALPLFAMLVAVGNGRFASAAIDPTLGRESPKMIVDGRVADNTTQQLLIFAAATFGLAASISEEKLNVICAAATVFVVARILFWIGYRIHPLYRAFGFAATAYLNAGLLIAALWLASP